MPLASLVFLIETTTTKETNSILASMAPIIAQRRKEISGLVTEAAINDNVSLIARCIDSASQLNQNSVKVVLYKSLKRAIHREAVVVLSYVLDHGANVRNVDGNTVTSQPDELSYKFPSVEVLQCLLAHGWNLNADAPLLWYVISDHAWVEWCFAHGATIEAS